MIVTASPKLQSSLATKEVLLFKIFVIAIVQNQNTLQLPPNVSLTFSHYQLFVLQPQQRPATMEERLKKLVRPVRGFPNPSFVFGDITPLLASPSDLKAVVDNLAVRYQGLEDLVAVAAPEARGFFFGAPLAYALGVPFLPIRKENQLPGPTYTSAQQEMDYGSRTMQLHAAHGDYYPTSGKVVLVDDILATGGSALACIDVLRQLGLTVHEVAIVYDYSDGSSVLTGKKRLLDEAKIPVYKLATFCYDGNMAWWLERGPEEEVIDSPHKGKTLKEH